MRRARWRTHPAKRTAAPPGRSAPGCEADEIGGEAHLAARIGALIRCVGRVVGEREVDGTATRSTRYYIASRSLSAPQLNALARGHWGIENSLHWVLDVVMNEDQNRSRKDNAPENLALLRRLALSIIKKDKSKGSNRIKFKRAGWDDIFLISLIAQI